MAQSADPNDPQPSCAPERVSGSLVVMSSDAETATTRVVRSFAFVDLSGFTALTDRDGDDRAVEVLRTFRTAVREVASNRGVRIAKWLGDGAMLVGVEPESLIGGIVDIVARISESSPLPLRAGVTIGPVILFEGDDYIGHAVNMASRLCDEAGPGEILAPSSPVAGLGLDAVVVEPAGSRLIRGIEEPISLVRISARA